MEEDVLERLKSVFDVCDERKEGYITVGHFKDLAKEHFGQFGDDEVIIVFCLVFFLLFLHVNRSLTCFLT